MRKKLAADEGQRKKFRAVVERFGKKAGYTGYSEETILLRHVADVTSGDIMTDHIWFTFTKGFQDAGVREGMSIEFDARVKEYTKGYVNKKFGMNRQSRDYKLSHPTKIRVLAVGSDSIKK